MQSIIRVLVVIAIVAFSLRTFSDNKADVDLWGNAGFVQVLPWQAGYHFTNTYSYTEPDNPWINHEWLGEYLLNRAYQVGGNSGMLLLKMVLGFLVIGLIAASMRRQNIAATVQVLMLLLIVSTMGYGFSTRPHHFTYVMLATWMYLLIHPPRAHRALWVVAAISGVLWANLHGAYFIGALVLLVYVVAALCERRAGGESATSRVAPTVAVVALLIFVAATFINPYGVQLWGFMFQSAAKVRPYLSEWAMFNPMTHAADHADFMALATVSCFALVASRAPRGIVWPVILLVAFGFAIAMRRNIPLFAIVAGFVVPPHLNRLAAPSLERLWSRLAPRAAALVLSAFIVLSLHTAWSRDKAQPTQIEIPQDRFPVGVMRFMVENELRGNALIFFDWAEYAIWHLHPRCKVFLDGRYRSAYGLDAIEAYFGFLYLSEDWDRALTEYPTDMAMVHVESDVYARMAQLDDTWELIAKDHVAGLFLRRGAHPYLDRAALRYPAVQTVELFP